jgi:hypothetical protein
LSVWCLVNLLKKIVTIQVGNIFHAKNADAFGQHVDIYRQHAKAFRNGSKEILIFAVLGVLILCGLCVGIYYSNHF